MGFRVPQNRARIEIFGIPIELDLGSKIGISRPQNHPKMAPKSLKNGQKSLKKRLFLAVFGLFWGCFGLFLASFWLFWGSFGLILVRFPVCEMRFLVCESAVPCV